MKAGATPKLIASANESNSFPTNEVPFNNLATLPSKTSKTAANKIAIIDKVGNIPLAVDASLSRVTLDLKTALNLRAPYPNNQRAEKPKRIFEN